VLRSFALAFVLLAHPLSAGAQTRVDDKLYFPGTTWEQKTPAEAGLNPALLREAMEFAAANETKAPRDLVMNHYQTFGREPFGYAIGPIRERGEPTGLIVRRGYVVAAWGEPLRVDMTHSVTKSFLSTLVGVAFDRGMIRSIDDPVRDSMAPIQLYDPNPAVNKSDRIGKPDLLFLFETPHNRTITWDHCCGRPATGRARCGASPTGPTGPPPTRPNGPRVRATRRARSISTTTRA
jgi:hypothetical protein